MKTLTLSVNILPSVSKPNIVLMLCTCISCTPKTSFQKVVVMAVNIFFRVRLTFSQTHKVGNNGINVNFVFPYIFSFPHCLDAKMLVNVKLDQLVKEITCQICSLYWSF